ncbi:MAG: cytochrome P450 [Pseudomonadota bacterium]
MAPTAKHEDFSSPQPSFQVAPPPDTWDGTLPDTDTFYADPHNWARAIVGRERVFEASAIPWMLRFETVEGLVKDPRLRQVGLEVLHFRGITEGPVVDWFGQIVLTANGPDHTRLRAPLQRTFSFPMAARMRPRVQELVGSLVDTVAERASGGESVAFDEVFADQLPIRVICEFLGVPPSDIPVFKRWTENLGLLFGLNREGQELADIHEAAAGLMRYAADLIKDRRKRPRDDFVSQFVAATDASGTFSPAELEAQLGGLIFAGHDTTRTALACALFSLVQHPDEWSKLHSDPDLAGNAVNETLRFEPAIGGMPRIANETLEVEGVEIPEGSLVYLSFTAAQRDPARYAAPNRLDISRQDIGRSLIVFGSGAHRCLGEALARIELEESLKALGQRFSRIEASGHLPHFDPIATGIRRLSGPLHLRLQSV